MLSVEENMRKETDRIMKNRAMTKTMTTMGLLMAVGLILPYATSHAFGIPGTILLPMHFPIFLMGMLCGPLWGIVGGLLVPLLSSLLTGMPAFYPMLPVMMCELAVYGGITGLLYAKKKMKLYPSLILAMIAGRLVHGAVWAALFLVGGKAVTFASAFAFVIDGIPGTALQLLLIPFIVKAVEKYTAMEENGKAQRNEVVEKAKAMIASEEASFVVIKNNQIIYQDKGNGVKPIMKVLDTDRELLQGAVIVDKIIGKAAAMMLSMGGAVSVYGSLMSQAAEEYLEKKGIEHSYGRCIQVISNRTGDGLCPLERAVADIDDEAQAYEKLKETIAKLMKAVV